MIRIITLVTLFLLFLTSVNAQVEVKVIVKDAKTQMELPYASISLLKNKISSTTDLNGFCVIDNITVFMDSLSCDYIGYKTKIIEITIEGDKDIEVFLEPESILLEEVMVTGRSSSLSGLDILKRAIKETKLNYYSTSTNLDGFYREKVFENNRCVEMNEANVRFEYSSYTKRKNVKKAFRHYFSSDYSGLFTYGSGHYFGNPLYRIYYNTPQDKVEILNGRLTNYVGEGIREPSPRGGPLALTALDWVKYQTDFFDKKLHKDYEYDKVGVVDLDGELCYVIRFRPKLEEQYLVIQNHKRPYSAIYSGTIYVSYEDNGVRQIDCRFSENADFSRYKRNDYCSKFSDIVDVTVRYQNINGKYGLAYVRTNQTLFKDLKQKCIPVQWDMRCERELWIQDIALGGIDSLQNEGNCLYQHPYSNLRDFISKYDSTFWSLYEQSALYPPISEAIVSNLERYESLNEQYSSRFVQKNLTPPIASLYSDTVELLNGLTYEDSFAWMQDSIMDFEEYVDLENLYFKNYFIPHRNRFYKIHHDLTHSVDLCNESVYQPKLILDFGESGDLAILTKSDGVKYDKVLLNVDALGISRSQIQYYRVNINEDHLLLSYVQKGVVTLLLKNLSNGIIQEFTVGKIGELFWIDNSNIGYMIQNKSGHDYTMKCLNVHKDTSYTLLNAISPFHELELDYTNDNRLLIYTRNSCESSIHYIDNQNLLLQAKLLLEMGDHGAFQVKEDHDNWYLLGNIGNAGYGIFRKGKNKIPQSWIRLLEGADEMIIDDYVMSEKHLLVKILSESKPKILLFNKSGEKLKELEFPEAYCSINLGVSKEEGVFVDYSSPNQPGMEYVWNDKSLKLESKPYLCFQEDRHKVSSKTEWVRTESNIEIPLTVNYIDDGRKKKGVVVKVYGAYNAILDHGYDEMDEMLLQNGYAVAKAHVRGGRMMGQDWSKQAKYGDKIISINDFIACVRNIRENDMWGSNKIIGYGQSAGGLILGSAVNKVPDLVDVAIFDHPYLDVYNTMSDTSLYLTKTEYCEWGDPSKSEQLDLILNYSPYETIGESEFPAMLFLSGKKDESTPSWQILKSVSKYRQFTQSNNEIVSFTSRYGHPGQVPYRERMRQMLYAFLFLEEN